MVVFESVWSNRPGSNLVVGFELLRGACVRALTPHMVRFTRRHWFVPGNEHLHPGQVRQRRDGHDPPEVVVRREEPGWASEASALVRELQEGEHQGGGVLQQCGAALERVRLEEVLEGQLVRRGQGHGHGAWGGEVRVLGERRTRKEAARRRGTGRWAGDIQVGFFVVLGGRLGNTHDGVRFGLRFVT
eukprot:2979695-Rhodomonas_salina.3